MEEVELIPSLSEESLMDPQALAKEARCQARIHKAVGRFSGCTSSLQQPSGQMLGPVGENMLLEGYQPGLNSVYSHAKVSKKVGNLILVQKQQSALSSGI